MIITERQFQSKAFAQIKDYLSRTYPNDFRFGSKNLLFDYVILRIDYDLFIKVIFEYNIDNIESIKKVFRSNKYSKSFVNRKFKLCYYKNDHTFDFIDL